MGHASTARRATWSTRRRRWRSRNGTRTSVVAATSSRRRSTRSGSTRPVASASTSARRPAASRTSCSSAARVACTRSTSAGASSPIPFAATNGSSRWSARTPERSRPGSLPEPVSLAVIDVSFISLGLVLGPVASTLQPGADAPIVALVKPQFEAGRGRTDHGVVRDPAIHREVLERVVAGAVEVGLGARGVIASPILGPEGNREFLVHFQAGPSCAEIDDLIREVTAA